MKVDPSAKKCVFLGFKGVFGYKLWDFETKKIVLSSNVTFDEASLMKSIDSQQVESIAQTIEVSQRVESDATPHLVEITPHSSDSSVSFGLSAEVTQLGERVASLDTEDIGNQGHGQVQDSIAAVEASLGIVEAIVLPVEVIGDCDSGYT